MNQGSRPGSATHVKNPSTTSNRSMHNPTSQPKQKYMSFLKKNKLEIEIPPDEENEKNAEITKNVAKVTNKTNNCITNKAKQTSKFEFGKEEQKKALSTKNAQRVTFDFDDPSSYPLQPA